jgi:hypothetical protein
MPKHTTIYANELRALPPRKFRFANIEVPKSDAWKQRQREKSLVKRAWEFVEERRFKFYVKESRAYTMKTGVPGVWEEVARGIRESTEREKMGEKKAKGGDTARRVVRSKTVAVKKDVRVQMPEVKRQTSRRV